VPFSGTTEGMGAAGLGEAANDGFFGGVEEDDTSWKNFADLREDGGKTLEAAALPDVNHESRVGDLGGLGDEVSEAGYEFEWEVVDGVEAEVFESLERGGLASTGEASENDELARLSIVGSWRLLRRRGTR